MTLDPIREYLDARQTLEEATRRTQSAVTRIEVAAERLRRWREVVTPSAGGFPIEMVNALSIDPWPTAQEVGNLLKAWHQAKREADNAWQGVPEGHRYGLQPPPK